MSKAKDESAEKPDPIVQNYRVMKFRFGVYEKDKVLPFSIANADGNLAYHIENRTLAPTTDPVSNGVGTNEMNNPDRASANNFIQLVEAQREIHERKLRENKLIEDLAIAKGQNEHFDKKLVESEREAARLNTILGKKGGDPASSDKLNQLLEENNQLKALAEAKQQELLKEQAELKKAQDRLAAEEAEKAQRLIKEGIDPNKPSQKVELPAGTKDVLSPPPDDEKQPAKKHK